MKELKQAIANNDVLMAGLYLANIFQSESFEPSAYQQVIQKWGEQAKEYILSSKHNSESFTRLIHYFYVELAFSGDDKNDLSCQHNLLNNVMDYRTGIPVSLSIVFQALGKSLGFDVVGINFPGHFLLKCQFSNEATRYIDPLNGKELNRADMNVLYFSILNEIENEQMPEEALDGAGCAETIVRLLHNLKASYIHEKIYSKALETVELLVNLCPNDPYERRDRGFLLHKLDCTQVAIADYQYFIRQCPKDPSSQLLQAQLQQLTDQIPQVFH